MERNEIGRRAMKLQTKEDLLQLLNDIVKDDLGEENAFSFSMKQLSYYCNPNNVRGRYRHFSIPKKSGEPRHISAPSKGLGHILYYINVILRSIYKPSDYAMGFVEGRSVVDNAIRHIDKNYVFNVDLKNFFPSIEQPRVWKRLQIYPFNFNQQIANIIAGLCCVKEKLEDNTFIYVLPQGAPTSPLLTNAICDKLDRRLNGLARRFGLRYTRYADDITFSSMHNVYQDGSEFQLELKRIIEGQGFKINEVKTRLQKKGQRRIVTGLSVSNIVNTDRKYVAEIRNLLHIWEKYGYNEAYKRFYPQYKDKKGHIKKGEPMLENFLYGKLQYLKMVKGSKDSVYLALQNRYDKLTSPVNAEVEQNLDYLRSFTLAEFEEMVDSPIQYALSKDNNIYGKVVLKDREIIIFITDAAKVQLTKNKIITDENLISNIKKVHYHLPANSKPGLFVVLTARNGKAPFWLMTYFDPTVTGIDLCDVPVHILLDIWEKEGIEAAINAFENGMMNTVAHNASNGIISERKSNPQKDDPFSESSNGEDVDNIVDLSGLIEDDAPDEISAEDIATFLEITNKNGKVSGQIDSGNVKS